MKYIVYILYSETLHQFYKGSTADLMDRLSRHNRGAEKSTSRGVPWKLLWFAEKASRSEASILERKLKNLSSIRTIEFMLKYSECIAGPDELLFIKQLSGC